jgi:phosphatidylserine/phosphatidylglycerophosphate/cardiolipin synthase-like enzyme
MGAGFNYGWLHYPREHPSNKGDNLTDLGLIVQGPVAQDALAAYDDLWEGGNQVYCADLSSGTPETWQATCDHLKASVSHLPEVMKIAPQGEESNSFSLFRNYNNKVGDQAIAAALANAQETLDIFEVNFSLELICMLDLLNDNICDYDNRLAYLESIMNAVEQNDVRVRVMVEKSGSNGLENQVTFKEFQRELERRGLEDNVELRWFKDRMHTKAVLIDNELVIVGSQNFHYSAWGEKGLAEYNVVSDDPRAVETFQDMFEYYWEIAIPFELEETASQ